MDRLDAVRRELKELRGELERLAGERQKKIAELDIEFERLAEVRWSPDPDDARAATARMGEIKAEIAAIKADGVTQDAAINTRISDKLVEEHFGNTEVTRLSDQLDNSLDPREIPQRQRQLAEAEQAAAASERAVADALRDSERATGLLNSTRAEMQALDNRIAGARRSVESTKAEVSSLENRIQELEAQRPIWDEIDALKKRINELEQEAMDLRVKDYDLETAFDARKAALEAEKARLAAELDQIRSSGAAARVQQLTEQIDDVNTQLARHDIEAQNAKAEMTQRIEAKLVEKDAALADRRAIERTLDPADEPAQLPQRRAEFDQKRADADAAQRDL
ncbi:MAG: hypothetical protein FJW32_29325, partial [Acidobacteria bacterium]|nr:hypothetical protein [Acidobacteriota bacterium]